MSELLQLLRELERNPKDKLARMRLASRMRGEDWTRDMPFREALAEWLMRASAKQAAAQAFFEGYFQGRGQAPPDDSGQKKPKP